MNRVPYAAEGFDLTKQIYHQAHTNILLHKNFSHHWSIEIQYLRFTSNIFSLDTSTLQWPVCGCSVDNSACNIFIFCTKSLLYLGTGERSVLPFTQLHEKRKHKSVSYFDINYRLITVCLLLQVNGDKIMHVRWDFDASNARTCRVSTVCSGVWAPPFLFLPHPFYQGTLLYRKFSYPTLFRNFVNNCPKHNTKATFARIKA